MIITLLWVAQEASLKVLWVKGITDFNCPLHHLRWKLLAAQNTPIISKIHPGLWKPTAIHRNRWDYRRKFCICLSWDHPVALFLEVKSGAYFATMQQKGRGWRAVWADGLSGIGQRTCPDKPPFSIFKLHTTKNNHIEKKKKSKISRGEKKVKYSFWIIKYLK